MEWVFLVISVWFFYLAGLVLAEKNSNGWFGIILGAVFALFSHTTTKEHSVGFKADNRQLKENWTYRMISNNTKSPKLFSGILESPDGELRFFELDVNFVPCIDGLYLVQGGGISAHLVPIRPTTVLCK
jgi:hypothetical protein